MAKKIHPKQKNEFAVKPLTRCIRAAVTGGLIAGNSLSAQADMPALPVPVDGAGFASYGAATTQMLGANTLQVDQATDRAILNWQSFNVARDHNVQFVQPGSASIALNRIHQQDPSVILGRISANGQIYLVNNNGFVFGDGAVVDTRSFVASALDMSDEVLKTGMTHELEKNANPGQPALSGQNMTPGNKGAAAAIEVQAGARIHVGRSGTALLAAPAVGNAGSISGDEQSQILLVASKDKVYLQPASSDDPFSGLKVEVGAGGQATNTGGMTVRQGNVTLAGFAVNQSGRISATTAVSVNGSIRLLAREGGADNANSQNVQKPHDLYATQTVRAADGHDGLGLKSRVTFGQGSVTEILPDADGGAAVDGQAQPASLVEASAREIAVQTGAVIAAPAGKVQLTATNRPDAPADGQQGRIYIGDGARIDVAGIRNVSADMERNVAEVSVQSYNLRNSPYQRGGVLQGETVRVDIRKDTGIIDTGNPAASLERRVDERLTAGGVIQLTSQGDILVGNAQFDISGGSVKYRDGYVNTTKLINDADQIVDIGDADPNAHYKGIYGTVTQEHRKWGVTETFDGFDVIGSAQFERGYVEGKAAGVLSIQTPWLAWRGDLQAAAIIGLYQRRSQAPGGAFNLNDQLVHDSVFSSQNISFQSRQPAAEISLDGDFPKQENGRNIDLVFSPDFIARSGLSRFRIKTMGSLAVDDQATLVFPALSELNWQAGRVDIAGGIHSAGGDINIAGVFTNSGDSGRVDLAAGSWLDVSGKWVNDYQNFSDALDPVVIDGGKVSLTADADLNFNAGAAVKADGGAWLASDGVRLTAGKGGDIALEAAQGGPSFKLRPDGDFSAYGLEQGGSLTLASGNLVVGSSAGNASDTVIGVSDGQFELSGAAGFGSIALNANNTTVRASVDLMMTARNRQLIGDFRAVGSGPSIAGFSRTMTLPEQVRKPVELTLQAANELRLEAGSRVRMDKGSTVRLHSANLGAGIYLDGLVETPAGVIDVLLKSESDLYNPAQGIWLGSHAVLDARGVTRLNEPDPFGHVTGEVLDGGKVSLAANSGYVVMEKGARIDASGARARLDVPTALADAGLQYTGQDLGSNAGSISVKAAEGAILDGAFAAGAGAADKRSGAFELTLDRNSRKETLGNFYPANALAVDVGQTQQTLLPSGAGFGGALPGGFSGRAAISADAVDAAGFDQVKISVPLQIDSTNNQALRLPGQIRFADSVGLNTRSGITLDAQVLGWTGSTGTVTLNTGFLNLGSSSYNQIADSPANGGGALVTHAVWTQLTGALSITGFGRVDLNSSHDLRTVGVSYNNQKSYTGNLATAAALNLSASQIYPSTLSDYAFTVTDPARAIAISGRNTDATPLSAAGKLTFNAPVIHQNGVLKAPLGTITLNADTALTFGAGSLTSVSADHQLIPFGIINNNFWEYPIASQINLVFNEAPGNLPIAEKHLNFNAPDIEFKAGSTVDAAGSGDLLAAEFQPGLGGEFDYLNPASPSYRGGFALIPALGSGLAPYDPYLYTGFGSLQPGQGVYLAAAGALPAGRYALLPARYALLPGAYLITPEAGTRDQFSPVFNLAGLPIVPGYNFQALTGARDARLSGFLIEGASQVRQHSDYGIQTANQFFAQKAAAAGAAVPLLPADSGQVAINAAERLLLDGQFNVAAVNGRGAKVDISADNIKVVNQLGNSPASGTLELLAQDLSNLRVDSLFLGGTRRYNGSTGGTELNVTAGSVVFDQGARVEALDLIAAARNTVQVAAGAAVVSGGSVFTGDSVLNLTGDSALLRVSAAEQVALNRANSDGSAGSLVIEQGSLLQASRSMLLDASKNTVLSGDINMRGGSLSLSAGRINIGETPAADGTALDLSNQKLLTLTVDELVLHSKGSINFYGNVGLAGDGGALSPLPFTTLVLDAAALSGFDNAGKAARIQADRLILQNSRGAVANAAGAGSGILELAANRFEQGEGRVNIDGFAGIGLTGNERFSITGNGKIASAGDLTLTAGLVNATGGHRLDIDAGGHGVGINGAGGRPDAGGLDFGGRLTVSANAITLNDAHINLPSGALDLTAETGDIAVNGHSGINLAGQAAAFADAFDYTPGGAFSAIARTGAVIFSQDTVLDVSSGGGDAEGGELILQAPQKTLVLPSGLKGAGAGVTIDVADFAQGYNFDNFINQLATAGITGSFHFRSRNADIVETAGQVFAAKDITLIADQGAISIAGTLSADHADTGGDIGLHAGGRVTLADGALLSAKGGDRGGNVSLSSIKSLTPGGSGIAVAAGAAVDVGGANKGGTVTLAALRTANGVNIEPVAGDIRGYSRFYAEGVKTYGNADLGGDGSVDGADVAAIDADTAQYMAAAGASLPGGMRLRPGVAINYSGDLALNAAWDFAGQRFGADGSVPGSLSIAATGSLSINQPLTDGYQNGQLMSGESWRFQLTAGSDAASADRLAVAAESRDLTLASGVRVQTGGDIGIAASGGLILADQTSVIVNTGRSDAGNPYGTLDGSHVGIGSLAGVPFDKFNVEYPTAGGNIVIRTGGAIAGAVSSQFITPWLLRQGSFDPGSTPDFNFNFLTAWGVDITQFQQNIGSFGGGRVDIRAGGDINDLSVMMPTTGKQEGLDFNDRPIVVNGGGEMTVKAGGDINGGVYFLGKGSGLISAGGAIQGSNAAANGYAFGKGPELVLSGNRGQPVAGDARLTLVSGQGTRISGAVDAMIINPAGNAFFSYTDSSALSLKALSGDVHLNADSSVINSLTGTAVNTAEDAVAKIFPASLYSTAFNGSIVFNDDISLFPAAVGNVQLFSRQAITSENGAFTLFMSDLEPATLPEASLPISGHSDAKFTNLKDLFDVSAINNSLSSPTLANQDAFHASRPLHLGDRQQAKIVTQAGDIESVRFNLPKQVIIEAGRDLINSPLYLQQVGSGDASVISAGRDIKFLTALDDNGNVDAVKSQSYQIQIAGPGQALLKSGRNVDLGSSSGLLSVGNVLNSKLPAAGAALNLWVGLNGGDPDYRAFIDSYLFREPGHASQYAQASAVVAAFMKDYTGNASLSEAEAWSAFGNLPVEQTLAVQPKLNPILASVLFAELKAAGSASAADKSLGNERGFKAIETLFPGARWQGDLSLFFSTLQTREGGDINLLVPGGQIDAGLAVATTGIQKSADQLGISVQKQGAFNAFVNGNFNVNTARVFTQGGGDLLIWSSAGDIDAGKGAKTAFQVTRSPSYYDENELLVIPPPVITSGSGIRTLAPPGTKAGDIYLFAPKGVVNAGEAGIAGNNVTISATAVLGANNIQVGGVSTGVPVAATGSVAAGLTGASNLNSAVNQIAENSVTSETGRDKASGQTRLGVLSVDVIGFGS